MLKSVLCSCTPVLQADPDYAPAEPAAAAAVAEAGQSARPVPVSSTAAAPAHGHAPLAEVVSSKATTRLPNLVRRLLSHMHQTPRVLLDWGAANQDKIVSVPSQPCSEGQQQSMLEQLERPKLAAVCTAAKEGATAAVTASDARGNCMAVVGTQPARKSSPAAMKAVRSHETRSHVENTGESSAFSTSLQPCMQLLRPL